MNAPAASRGEMARQFYNAAAVTSSGFSFMNYGYAPLSAELAASDEPERYCLQLYRHLLRDADLAGQRVVEVSSGRGGGAAHVARVYQPAAFIGIDISEQNVNLASTRHAGVANLRFRVGNAEDLPLGAGTCNALVNVEAAHLYDNPARFFDEALRVLVPGGMFFHADLAWADKDPVAHIKAAGFTIDSVEDITANVLLSLEADSDRREAIVMSFPENLRDDFRDWSGVRGHRAYRRLESREWIYRAIRARRG
jgi:SAM-dependent methyltransferase